MDREELAVTGDPGDVGGESSVPGSHEPNSDGAHPDVLPDAADTEAGVPAPEDRMTMKERLERAEARSLRHLMTHLPKNTYCAHCQRAKITSKPARIRKWVSPEGNPKRLMTVH